MLTRIRPSLATVFRTTSIAPVYTPFSAVCNRTLTRSKGCPTTTAKIPPTPPAAKSRKLETDFFAATATSCSSSFAEGSLSVMEGAEEEEDEEDMAGLSQRAWVGCGSGSTGVASSNM